MAPVDAFALRCRPWSTVMQLGYENESGYMRSDLAEAMHSEVSVQFSSVAQWCLTLCDPMNHSMPGLPVHYQLPESTQTHVYWVSDAIQSSHPLSSPSPAVNLSQHQGLFQWVSSTCIRWPKYWSFSFNISPSNEHQDWSPLGWTGWTSLQSKRFSRVFSNTW